MKKLTLCLILILSIFGYSIIYSCDVNNDTRLEKNEHSYYELDDEPDEPSISDYSSIYQYARIYDIFLEILNIIEKYNGDMAKVKVDPFIIDIKSFFIQFKYMDLKTDNLTKTLSKLDKLKFEKDQDIAKLDNSIFANLKGGIQDLANNHIGLIHDLYKFIKTLKFELNNNPDLICLRLEKDEHSYYEELGDESDYATYYELDDEPDEPSISDYSSIYQYASLYDIFLEILNIIEKYNGDMAKVKVDPFIINIKSLFINFKYRDDLKTDNLTKILSELDKLKFEKDQDIAKLDNSIFANLKCGIQNLANNHFGLIRDLYKFIKTLKFELKNNPDLIYLFS